MPGGGFLDDLSRGGPAVPEEGPAIRPTGGVDAEPTSPAGADNGAHGSPPPGLRAQVGATRGAATRLVKAHIDLARAEFGEIMGEVKRLAIAAGIAFGLLLLAGILLPVGGLLFLGEWLFGSLGWGVLLGTELCVAAAVAAVLLVLGATRAKGAATLMSGVLAGLIVGLVLGLDLTNQGWSRLGDNVFPGIEPGVRPLATALAGLALVVGIVGLLAGLRTAGLGGAIAGLIGGALLGALLGALTAIRWGPQAGAAAGVAVGLVVWPAALATAMVRRGFDFDAIKERLTPNVTMEMTRETIEWAQKQTPLGRKS